MAFHIALLRAVNVAGHGAVSMAALRTFFEDLGFAGARSLMFVNAHFSQWPQPTSSVADHESLSADRSSPAGRKGPRWTPS